MEYSQNLSASQTREEEIRKRRLLGIKFDNMTRDQQAEYKKILRAMKHNKTNRDEPNVPISLDDELKLAEKIQAGEDMRALLNKPEIPGINPIKMERLYESATIQNGGRPPIGGAKDD